MQPHDFWQDVHPAGSFDRAGPFSGFFPATLDDGSQIRLPIRPLADGEHALASLIINQASFDVQDALAADLAPRIAAFRPDACGGRRPRAWPPALRAARDLAKILVRRIPVGAALLDHYARTAGAPLCRSPDAAADKGQARGAY